MRRPNTKNLLLLSFIIETLCVTYLLKFPTLINITRVLYFASGLAIAFLFTKEPEKKLCLHVNRKTFAKPIHWYRFLFIFITSIALHHFAMKYMDDAPLYYKDADMLPIIKVMNERMLAGNFSHVYDMIPEIWGGMKPIYLPAMWMPFGIPLMLHLDIRWLTFGALLFAFIILICLWKPLHQRKSLIFLIPAFGLFWWLLTQDDSGLIPYTEEGVVILYYVLLTLALLTESYLFIGIAAGLCTLSRYGLVGWLPAMFVFLILLRKRKEVVRFSMGGIACFVFLLLIPFGCNICKDLIALPSSYINFAERVWSDSPELFTKTPGFAAFFGPGHIALQHHLLVILSFAVPTLFILICLSLKELFNKTIHNIPLATLKIALVIFYSFIDVPYLYLFYTSSFVSLIAIAYLISLKEDPIATV